MIDEIAITSRPTCVAKTDLVSKFAKIKESEILYHLDIYCQDKPVLIRELLTEQTYVAIKRFEDSTIRPLPHIHFYFPVKNLGSPPDFLLLLLMKYKNCENNVVINTLSGEFKTTPEFISALEKKGYCQEITFKEFYNPYYGRLNSEQVFCRSIRKYAKETSNDKMKTMADIITMDIFLSNPNLCELQGFDFHLVEIDTQRMAEKGYYYHLFETDEIYNVFEDKKFIDFTNSSASQAEFNFIFGVTSSNAVSVQRKDDKLIFVSVDFSNIFESLSMTDLERYRTRMNNIKSRDTEAELSNLLMDTSNIKIISLGLETRLARRDHIIFSRDFMVNLMKNPDLLNKIRENGEYGTSFFLNPRTEPSVMDAIHPILVRVCQRPSSEALYEEAFYKNGLLDDNVRKNKSNKPQTLEQYRTQHSINEEEFNYYTEQPEKKIFVNKGIFDERKKLLIDNSNFLCEKFNRDNKANINNKETRSYLELEQLGHSKEPLSAYNDSLNLPCCNRV